MEGFPKTPVRIGFLFALISALVLVVGDESRAQVLYDMSDLGANDPVTLLFDANNPDLVSGIFRNKAPDNKVEVTSRGWVAPAGAGIFHASAAHPMRDVSCRLVLDSKTDRPRILELHVRALELWHRSEVIENKVLTRADGSEGEFSLARSIDGKITAISVSEQETSKPTLIETTLDGKLANGQLGLDQIGNVEVNFRSNLNGAVCYLFINGQQKALLDQALVK